MKTTKQLISLAEKLSNKYGSINADYYRSEIENNIKTALANVSMQNNPQVMIPFINMLNKDQATLTFDVTRNDSFGRKNITVSNFSVVPNENNAYDRYLPLIKQIENYLETNWELYPSQRNGAAIDYNNFTIRCQYQGNANQNNALPTL